MTSRWPKTASLAVLAVLLVSQVLLALHQGVKTFNVIFIGIVVILGVAAAVLPARIEWPAPELEADEQARFTIRGSWSRKGIARGGSLILTDRRLIFEPNTTEAKIGLRPVSWACQSIAEVDVAPRGFNPISGAWRRRLRVVFADGTDALFVVRSVDSISSQVRALVGQG